MKKMKKERLRRKWTQLDLGYHARISVPDISRYETGRMKLYPSHRERLAKVLNIDPDELTREA